MAIHGSLRSDAYDPESVYDVEMVVLVPGPSWPSDPKDITKKTIRFPDGEAVREVMRRQHQINAASTFSYAAKADDVIYENVIHKTGDLYAANPDDPANPNLISVGGTITVQEEGTPLTQRDTINFIGGIVTATDDAGNSRTNITITGTGTEIEVQEEGTPLTPRGAINFIGASVTAVDDAGNSRTNVTIVDTNTTYSAGDGLDLTSTTFAVDLAANKGLVIISTELACDVYEDSHLELDANGIGIDWDGMPGFTGGNKQTLCKDASVSLPNYPEWVDSPQKVIWGLDPDGGHTFEVVGDVLRLTLKATKFTFDLVNLVSEEDVDLEINCEDTGDCVGEV